MDILARLEPLAEPGYRAFTQKMIPTKLEILGVRAAHLDKLASEVLKGDFRAFLDSAPDGVLEVLLIKTAALGAGKMDLAERFDRIRAFLTRIDNWAVCDSLMGWIDPKPDERAAWFEFLSPFFTDEREFFARFAAVMMIRYADPDWIEKAINALASVRQKDYYARMGVAWALSHLYVDFPQEVETLLKAGTLDVWSHNKTIQKVVESRRVDDDAKTKLKSLKRRKL
jgi:3-methyladenine DNA glycosylase AlkD